MLLQIISYSFNIKAIIINFLYSLCHYKVYRFRALTLINNTCTYTAPTSTSIPR